jgi:hypothetical protein
LRFNNGCIKLWVINWIQLGFNLCSPTLEEAVEGDDGGAVGGMAEVEREVARKAACASNAV